MNKDPIYEKYEDKKLDLMAWSIVIMAHKLLIKDYTLDFEVRAVSWIDKEFERVKSLRSIPSTKRIGRRP